MGPAAPLAVLSASMPALGGLVLLWNIEVIATWLRGHGALGVVVYTAAFIVLSGFALLPTYAQAILGGWAFGTAIGLPAALLGFGGGAIIGYTLSRRVASDKVMEVIETKPKWKAVRDALIESGRLKELGLITLVRIPPNSPFAFMNLLLGSTRTHPLLFLVGTMVGMAPRTAVAVFLAAQTRAQFSASEFRDEVSMPRWMFIASIVITLIAFFIIAHIANKAIQRLTAGPEAREEA